MRNYHFFAYVSRMKLIARWGLMRNTRQENDLEHSAQTAMAAHALAVIGNLRYGRHYDTGLVTQLALYHDCCEVITGDMPTPVKHGNAALHREYERIENAAAERLERMLPDDIRPAYAPLIAQDKELPEHRLVKAADRICAYIKCVEEKRAGNSEFDRAGESTLAALHAMELPEVEDYMREFMPGFALTLDEITQEDNEDAGK